MQGAGLTTSTCGQEELGIEPKTQRLVYNALYLLEPQPPIVDE